MEATVISSCSLNQWAMDFQNNARRILDSIVQSKRVFHSKIRVGSLCEIPGLSAEDHLLEPDTIFHSWDIICKVLELTRTRPYDDILCSIGSPINFLGSIFNCSVLIYNGEILLIRPQLILCNDSLRRDKRWFTAWQGGLVPFDLPQSVKSLYGQDTTMFGNALLKTEDNYLIGIEMLDETKSVAPISIEMFLMGAHVVLGLGGNVFEMKDVDPIDCVKSITNKTGGAYVYGNQVGFDGGRNYYDGSAMVFFNGKCLAMTDALSMKEIEIAAARVNLEEIDMHRSVWPSRNLQSAILLKNPIETIRIRGFSLKVNDITEISPAIPYKEYSKSQLVTYLPGCYLWDYLRRSTASGFFIALNGGIESASVVLIIYNMCERVLQSLKDSQGYNRRVIEEDIVRIIGYVPETAKDMMGKVLFTAFYSSINTSDESKARAAEIAKDFGANFMQGSIDEIFDAYVDTYTEFTKNKKPFFKTYWGSDQQDIALQCLQSRIRLVLNYISGQLLPIVHNRKGFLIVLAYTSLEQNLCGYHTKYGVSSGDINPIGCISQSDLKLILAENVSEFTSLTGLSDLKVFNELTPLPTETEADLELTFDEIKVFSELRKGDKCGPYTMFLRCCEIWEGSPKEISAKVKRFFTLYADNRHKSTVLTPLVHFSSLGTDDNRSDLRPFLYNIQWTSQFSLIDEYLAN